MAHSKRSTRTPTKRSSIAQPSARPKPSAAKAVSAADFETALTKLNIKPPFAVAVSGGSDSLALMLLAARWCKRHGSDAPRALTVDHGLRKDSGREALQVAHWAHVRGIPHETLVWIGHKPAENIQARAREARYRLLGERMRALGLTTLLTGHTRDDQAETFFLRLGRGSGLDGLSGMAPVAPFPVGDFPELRIVRPLLDFSHESLKRTLSDHDQPWIDDPSNQNERFARVQIRKAMTHLTEAGLTAERVAAATAHLRRAREAIDDAVFTLLASAADVTQWGYALLRRDRLNAAPREVGLRALASLVETFGGGQYPPRFEQTEALLDWLLSGAGPKGRTLGGCRFARRDDRSTVLMAREETALAKENPVLSLNAGESAVWDRRFVVTLAKTADVPVEVRRLGPAGVKDASGATAMPSIEPRRIAAGLPGIWRDGRLVSAPSIGFDPLKRLVSVRFLGVRRGERTQSNHL